MSTSEVAKQTWKTKDFVAAYLKIECLWNTQDQEYKNRNTKNIGYEELSKQFSLNSEQVKTKIRVIRTTYKQEKKKMENSADYYPKLSWFSLVEEAFNHGRIKSFNKSIQNSIQEPELKTEVEYEVIKGDGNDYLLLRNHNDEENSEIYIEEYSFDEESEPQKKKQKILYADYCEENGEQYDDSAQSSEKPEIHKTYNPDNSLNDNNLPIAVQRESEGQSSSSKQQNRLSSNEHFLMSLVDIFDSLPKDKNMLARLKVQEMLYNLMQE